MSVCIINAQTPLCNLKYEGKGNTLRYGQGQREIILKRGTTSPLAKWTYNKTLQLKGGGKK